MASGDLENNMLQKKKLKDSILEYISMYLSSGHMEMEDRQLDMAYSVVSEEEIETPEQAAKCLQRIHLGLTDLPWPTHPRDITDAHLTDETDVTFWKLHFWGGSIMDTWVDIAGEVQMQTSHKKPIDQWGDMVSALELNGYAIMDKDSTDEFFL